MDQKSQQTAPTSTSSSGTSAPAPAPAFGNQEMFVTKRNGKKEIISFDKILKRIKKVGNEIKINYTQLVIKIIDQLYDGIPTDKIDEISAEQCASMSSIHYDYGTIASRIAISNHHRNTSDSFSSTMKKLGNEGILNKTFLHDVQTNAKALDALCDYQRDYLIDYFGFKTLERSYLLSIRKKVYERPQMMFMRLAVAIHGSDMTLIEETYNALSNKYYIHGTPSLFNAGTKREQMSSCFVKGTRVITENRGPVEIQDVVPGDQVRTHTGQIQRVDQVHENSRQYRKLYRLKFYGKPAIVATENHPFYVYDTTEAKLAWKEVEQLYEDHKESAFYAQLDKYDFTEFPNIENDNDLNFESPCMIESAGFHYVKLESVVDVSQEFAEEESVYTLGVDQDHSYNVEGIIVKNCYLLAMEDDSIDGIFNTLKDCALISKYAGGIGLHIHNIRATGTHIAGTNGQSNGIVPMLRVFNHTAKYVDQCLTPSTIIYTSTGPIRMDQIVEGETQIMNYQIHDPEDDPEMPPLVNEDGSPVEASVETVQKVLEHAYDDTILHIYTKYQGTNSMEITPEHPVYAIRGNGETVAPIANIQAELDRNIRQPEWVEAGKLDTTDLIAIPIPTYEKDVTEITEADCYLYGVMISSNAIDNNDTGSIGNLLYNIQIRANQVDVLSDYFNERFIKFHHSESEEDGTHQMQWSRTAANFPFRRNDFYDSNGNIQIGYRILNLPKHKIAQIVRGYVDTNGTIDKEIRVSYHSSLRYETLRYLFLKLGIFIQMSYGVFHSCTIPVTKSVCDVLGLEYDGRPSPYVTNDRFLFTPVVRIQNDHYSGILYDLQMKDNHNYLLANGLVHNGGGKRNGSFAIYLEPWHADIDIYLQLRKNHGEEELKARDLFYALWVPDLFMKRIKANEKWSLFCPHECPGLADVYGDEFEALYTKYEQEGKARSTVQARDLWFKVLDAQMETGTPYLVYKDAANKKSNQKNLGTIKSSNLCVAPETRVLTDRGNIMIRDLKDQVVNVWNGFEFSEVTVRQTGHGPAHELIQVHTSDGAMLSCTKYHKFYIKNYSEGAAPDTVLEVEARNLSVGDTIIDWTCPSIEGQTHIEDHEAYLRGICMGNVRSNNTNSDEYSFIILKTQEAILKKIPYKQVHKRLYTRYESEESESRVDIEKLEVVIDKKVLGEDAGSAIPNDHVLRTKMMWFSGLYDMYALDTSSDSVVLDFSKNLESLPPNFVYDVKQMLQTCGVNPCIDPIGNLTLTGTDCEILSHYHFCPLVAKLPLIRRDGSTKSVPITITKIVHDGRKDETYCFTEPKRHMGVFNGMLTGQCSEIIEYSDSTETAVCNLCSIALPSYVTCHEDGTVSYDFDKLHQISKMATYNLNRIIDINYYPTEKTKKSNMRHRPIGIGVQGLADTFFMMGYGFGSEESVLLNKQIFETIYHGSLEASCEIAQKEGPYETFAGSPASEGKLQFDLWDAEPLPDRYDWTTLKRDIVKYGIRNSLLLAPMPTASTSQILGFNECIEPITSNIYSRRTLAGEFIIVNRYLMRELIKLGLWNERMKNFIIANNGSIQGLDIIPKEVQEKYKTVWEIPMRSLIDMAADRGIYVDQSQSLNLWLEDPTYGTLTSMHFYSWSKGLKTGIYYLRRRAKHQAQKFTIEPEKATNHGEEEEDEICEMCSG